MSVKIFIAALLLMGNLLFSQVAGDPLKQILEKDSATVEALAMYPDSIRTSALECALYPEILIKLDELQGSSSASFRNILAVYPKEDQKQIWDLVRYEGLPDAISKGGKKTDAQLKEIASKFPESARTNIVKYGASHFDVFVKISSLAGQTESALSIMIKDYSLKTQRATRTVVKYPELVDLLTDNIKTSILLGDAYRNNGSVLSMTLDSLSLDLARRNAKDLEEWKKGLENNPNAKKEFEKSAKEYAEEQGYDEKEYAVKETTVITEYVYYPYPYWYGYPWWWDQPYWYPYPYWYHWGYYYGPYGIVHTGCPSWFFIHWHFHHHHHHYYYPHFSDYCVGYYYGPRRSTNGVRSGVAHWIRENNKSLPADLLKNDASRPVRFKEFGKMEIDRAQYNKTHPEKTVTKDEYYKENTKKYPNIGDIPREEKPKTYETNPAPRPKKDPVITPPRTPEKPYKQTPPKNPAPPTPKQGGRKPK